MPELAEVEFFRQQWDSGFGSPILGVELHAKKRVFRGQDLSTLRRVLRKSKLIFSEARGKQMLFRFSNHAWIGLHLGMTGNLRIDQPVFVPGKHDHLVLRQRRRSLVFADPRCFGRVRFHFGSGPPDWWANLPPAINSDAFTHGRVKDFLRAHGKAPLKAVLLLQNGFPGVGNWMADEILWQSGLHPRTPAAALDGKQTRKLWRVARSVCRQALRAIGRKSSDPPPGWLFHERWKKTGRCPRHSTTLARATVGGRTTTWCVKCQGRG